MIVKMALGALQGWLKLPKQDMDIITNMKKGEIESLVSELDKIIPNITASDAWKVAAKRALDAIKTKIV